MNTDTIQQVKTIFLDSFVYWSSQARLAKQLNEPELRSTFSELSQLALLWLAEAGQTTNQSRLMNLVLEFDELEEEVILLADSVNWEVTKT